MIYVCRYDFSLPPEVLLRIAGEPGVPDGAGSMAEPGGCNGRKWEHLRERILARLLLLYAVRREYGIESLSELGIAEAEGGKPFSQARPELFFNLSHCHTACACIVSDSVCGIDVEQKFAFRPALAGKICSPREKLLMNRLDAGGKERLLQLIWPMKESYVKCDGRGLRYGLERVDLSGCLEEWMRLAESQEDCTARWTERDGFARKLCGRLLQPQGPGNSRFLIRVGHSCTLSAFGENLPEEIWEIQERELLV